MNLIDKESDDVLERIMDEKTASESKILYGHSGPVYGVSFSPDRYKKLSAAGFMASISLILLQYVKILLIHIRPSINGLLIKG